MRHPLSVPLVAVAVAAVLLSSGCRTMMRPAELSVEERSAIAGDELTAEERTIARDVAERALRERKLVTTGKLYLVNIEWLRDKEAEARGVTDRKAMVTHYRYDGDMAIVTIVNLSQRTLITVETAAHLPTPLATEEFSRARELALAQAEVQAALAPYGDRVVAEALVARASSRADPFFGHRVVRLMFRVGPDYLTRPIAIVDLTTERVTIERPPGTQ